MTAGPYSLADSAPFSASAAESRAGHAWALALSASLVVIVCVRFFSESLGLLPRVAQYVDAPVTLVALFCFALSFIRRGRRITGSRYGLLLYLFLLVSLGSAVINLSRTQLLPVLMFIFNFLAPLVMIVVTINAPMRRRNIETVVRTFFWLGILQLAIGVLYDFPRFLVSNDPDVVSGTFGLNAYQFTYFLGFWFLYVLGGMTLATKPRRRGHATAVGLAAIAVYVLFYAAQYRAMLLFFTVVILLALWASPSRISRRLMLTAFLSTVSVLTLIVVATAFPNLKLLKVFDLAKDSTPLVQSGKVKAVENVWKMYGDMPQTALAGTGPATFSSRAYETFSNKPRPEKEVIGAMIVGARGGQLYVTDVARQYVETIPFVPIQGGTQMSNPQSSYTSLAAEVGLAGLAVYLAIYGLALRFSYRRLRAAVREGDPLAARLAFACFGGIILLLVQALFDNWLETTRLTIPLWILIGLLYALGRRDHAVDQGSKQDAVVQSQPDPG